MSENGGVSRWLLPLSLLLALGCSSEPASNPGVVRDEDARSQYGPRAIDHGPLPEDPYAGLLGSQAQLPPKPDPEPELNPLEELARRGAAAGRPAERCLQRE